MIISFQSEKFPKIIFLIAFYGVKHVLIPYKNILF